MYGEPGSFAILQLCACQRPDFLILKGTRLFFPETFKNTLNNTAQKLTGHGFLTPYCSPDLQDRGKSPAGLNWFMKDTMEHWDILTFIYLFDNLLLILFFRLCSVLVFLPLILTWLWQRDYLMLTCQINWLILPTGWIYNTLTLAIWVFYRL